jgi:hypothetical protein
LKKLATILTVVFAAGCSVLPGQNIKPPEGFWHQESLNGELRLSALYRQQKSFYDLLNEDQRSTYFIGGLKIISNSYLWSKDIVSLNLTGEFNPESRKEKYLVIPDRSEVRTLSNIDFRTTIFNNKPVTISLFGGHNQSYYNRELLTNVKTRTNNYGGMISLNNKIVPLSVSYRNSDWLQTETEDDRTFSMKQEDIEARVTKSFTELDRNELVYAHNRYRYSYAGMNDVNNVIDRLALTDNISFDKKKRYNLSSYGSLYDQKGTNTFRKADLIERLYLQFTPNLRLLGDYSYYRMKEVQAMTRNRESLTLTHKLYESLTTTVFGEHSTVVQTVYNESNVKAGAGLEYTKKIPPGRLNLSYRYYHHWYRAEGVPAEVMVSDEEHQLSDTQITLLLQPYVKQGSVVVTDDTRTVIYQEGFDYILFARGSYTGIQRVPGGLIADGQPVKVEYTYTLPGSYGYEADNNSWSAGIILFRNLFELYYRGARQNYPYLRDADFLVLNRYSQDVAGVRLDFRFAAGGLEYESYRSNIIPYNRMRYFINLNWTLKSRLAFSVNGNISDYTFTDDNIRQLYSNISGKVSVIVTRNLRVNLESSYLDQAGRNIDLKLITARAEAAATFRLLTLKLSNDMYLRKYPDSDFRFFGTRLELIRRF